ncbi:MAG: hypothetical protein GKC04_02400 [Methanomicrobiales archaeon]|nr:hypothetical protein [Methanomicrobiales archaeon]
MKEHENDDIKRIAELICRLLAQSLAERGEQPIGYGFTIIAGNPDSRDGGACERCGNTEPRRRIIEPRIEIHPCEDQIHVTAEVAGAEGQECRYAVRKQCLHLAVPAGDRVYQASVSLPPVEEEPVRVTCRHGVLEVVLKASHGEKESSP